MIMTNAAEKKPENRRSQSIFTVQLKNHRCRARPPCFLRLDLKSNSPETLIDDGYRNARVPLRSARLNPNSINSMKSNQNPTPTIKIKIKINQE